jgi:hypothetical protein
MDGGTDVPTNLNVINEKQTSSSASSAASSPVTTQKQSLSINNGNHRRKVRNKRTRRELHTLAGCKSPLWTALTHAQTISDFEES